MVWDEENLDYLEASKTPKQKITEPKTPYYAADPVDGMLLPVIVMLFFTHMIDLLIY